MALITDAVGKACSSVTFAIGREKVRDFALAVRDIEPPYLDLEATRAAGCADFVAPPMFAVVQCAGEGPGDLRSRGRNRLLAHGPRSAGVRVGAAGRRGGRGNHHRRVKAIEERGEMEFFVFDSLTINQVADAVCVGSWTNIVRRSS